MPRLRRRDEPDARHVEALKKDIDTFAPGRYRVVRALGQGSFGVVCLAINLQTGEPCAVKRIDPSVFEFDNAGVNNSLRILREIRLLNHFRHQPLVVGLKDLLAADSSDRPAHEGIVLVMDVMESDMQMVLSRVRQERGAGRGGACDRHCQHYMHQLLSALEVIHGAGVIHRDVKPENILVNSDSSLKLCDFGLGRSIATGMSRGPITSRLYCAPELVLQCREYGGAVDVWSAGCVLAEMISAIPLFNNAATDPVLLQKVVEMTGPLDNADAESLRRSGADEQRLLRLQGGAPLSDDDVAGRISALLGGHGTDTAVELLVTVLRVDPARRPGASELLRHAYLENYHSDEILPPAIARFESVGKMDPQAARRAIAGEVMDFPRRRGSTSTGSVALTVSISDPLPISATLSATPAGPEVMESSGNEVVLGQTIVGARVPHIVGLSPLVPNTGSFRSRVSSQSPGAPLQQVQTDEFAFDSGPQLDITLPARVGTLAPPAPADADLPDVRPMRSQLSVTPIRINSPSTRGHRSPMVSPTARSFSPFPRGLPAGVQLLSTPTHSSAPRTALMGGTERDTMRIDPESDMELASPEVAAAAPAPIEPPALRTPPFPIARSAMLSGFVHQPQPGSDSNDSELPTTPPPPGGVRLSAMRALHYSTAAETMLPRSAACAAGRPALGTPRSPAEGEGASPHAVD